MTFLSSALSLVFASFSCLLLATQLQSIKYTVTVKNAEFVVEAFLLPLELFLQLFDLAHLRIVLVLQVIDLQGHGLYLRPHLVGLRLEDSHLLLQILSLLLGVFSPIPQPIELGLVVGRETRHALVVAEEPLVLRVKGLVLGLLKVNLLLQRLYHVLVGGGQFLQFPEPRQLVT